MTIEEMKTKKREKGYTYNMMSQLSGVPLGTIQKIFNGETKSPRYDTLMALERIFQDEEMVVAFDVCWREGLGCCYVCVGCCLAIVLEWGCAEPA